MKRSGMTALSAETGLELLDAAGRAGAANVVAASWDMAGLRGAGAGLPAVLADLVPRSRRAQRATVTAGLAMQVAGLAPEQAHQLILEAVTTQVAVVLGHASAAAIDAGQSFKDLGFDSLSAVEIRNRLTTATGIKLPATLAFDYPTPTALAEHLLAQLTARTRQLVTISCWLRSPNWNR